MECSFRIRKSRTLQQRLQSVCCWIRQLRWMRRLSCLGSMTCTLKGKSMGLERRSPIPVMKFGESESTEWSIVFDQTDGQAVYYHRENYEQGYAIQIQ